MPPADADRGRLGVRHDSMSGSIEDESHRPDRRRSRTHGQAIAMSATGGLIGWMKGLFRKGEPEVSWFSRLMELDEAIFWAGARRRRRPERPRSSPRSRRSPCCRASSSCRVGVVSVRGNYREHNEDNFYVPGRRSVRHDSGSESQAEMPALTLEPSNLFIVADGMGGQQAGEQASLMAVELIPKAIARRLPPDETEPSRIKDAIRDAVAEVNQEILGSSGAVTEFSNMGTTVVLAQFRFDRVYVAGIGDSRAYRLRDGRLEQLTKDHSLADALLEAGTITAEELPNHKFKNVLYLYLGSKDARGGPEDVRVLDVRPGDRLLHGQRRPDRRRPRRGPRAGSWARSTTRSGPP